MNNILTKQTVYDRVRQSLGEGLVAVEISDKQIDDAVKRAVDLYNRHKPRVNTANVTLIGGGGRYIINQPHVTDVVDVQFIEADLVNGAAGSNLNPFTFNTSPGMNGIPVDQYVLQQMGLEDARRVMTSLPDWQSAWGADADGNPQLSLYVSSPGNWLATYTYHWHMTYDYVRTSESDTTYGVWGLQHMDRSDIDWFIGFVAAVCKAALARAYRKFGGIPGEDGTPMQMDGDALMLESQEEVRALTEEIERRRHRTIPTTA